MKLRIKGNSIRLRLSQGEVDDFGATGIIKDEIQFGIKANQKLTYILTKAEVTKLKCEFHDNTIQVFVPKELGEIWVNSQLVGMEHLQTTGEESDLSILIEKDFKCLHVRINEDESDSFPHPKS